MREINEKRFIDAFHLELGRDGSGYCVPSSVAIPPFSYLRNANVVAIKKKKESINGSLVFFFSFIAECYFDCCLLSCWVVYAPATLLHDGNAAVQSESKTLGQSAEQQSEMYLSYLHSAVGPWWNAMLSAFSNQMECSQREIRSVERSIAPTRNWHLLCGPKQRWGKSRHARIEN